jgi:SAM-dependent methyltransferase
MGLEAGCVATLRESNGAWWAPARWRAQPLKRARSVILAEMADPEPATTIRERNRRVFASPFGAVYDFYIRRERLSQLIARFAWHSDVRPFYASMAAIPAMPDGCRIVDAPCGSGVALRALRPEQCVRYLGHDLSPEMLRRARRHAESSDSTRSSSWRPTPSRSPSRMEAQICSSPISGCTAYPTLRPD